MKNIQTRMTAMKANYKKLALLFVGSLLIIAGASAFHLKADNPDGIVGVWKTGEGTAMVRIYKNGDKYQGKIVWLKEPNDPETGKPKVDKNHPEAASKNRAILGLVNITFVPNIFSFVIKAPNIYKAQNGTGLRSFIRMIFIYFRLPCFWIVGFF